MEAEKENIHKLRVKEEDTNFYERGIRKLPKRWKLVIKNHGNHFIE